MGNLLYTLPIVAIAACSPTLRTPTSLGDVGLACSGTNMEIVTHEGDSVQRCGKGNRSIYYFFEKGQYKGSVTEQMASSLAAAIGCLKQGHKIQTPSLSECINENSPKVFGMLQSKRIGEEGAYETRRRIARAISDGIGEASDSMRANSQNRAQSNCRISPGLSGSYSVNCF